MMQAEQNIVASVARRIDEQILNDLIVQTIPIYTRKRPNPKTGKEDCRLTVSFKKCRRLTMRQRLEKVWDDEEQVKAIIERYAKTEQ